MRVEGLNSNSPTVQQAAGQIDIQIDTSRGYCKRQFTCKSLAPSVLYHSRTERMIDSMSARESLYTRPVAMEPLLPQSSKEQMAKLSCAILQKSGALSAQIPASQVRS